MSKGGPGVPRGVSPPRGLTKALGALGPGVKVPLELHVTLWLHGVHDHLEGTVELEADLGGGLQGGACHNAGISGWMRVTASQGWVSQGGEPKGIRGSIPETPIISWGP